MNPSHFTIAYETLRWGRDALDELDREARNHIERWPSRLVVDFNPILKQKTVKLVLEGGLPGSLARRANEAIGFIKNSFDQATHAA